ncbi:MAG: riboflavin synthase [Planctomycetes bacterium]|nr:riboflavin synthase [Planctomycetota bacterium]
MFTGIIEACVPIVAREPVGQGARLFVAEPSGDWDTALGDSIATSGCCLTVARRVAAPDGSATLVFDLSAETLERTWFRSAAPGRALNLERAARLSDRLGGHLVSGHVDGLGHVTRIEDRGDGGREMHFEVPAGLERYLIEKGSIAIDGISLTVVEPRGRSFRVALIPETLKRTTLGRAALGDAVHLEADLVGKWIERLLDARR